MFDDTDTGPPRLASSDVLGGGGGGVADRGISSERPGDEVQGGQVTIREIIKLWFSKSLIFSNILSYSLIFSNILSSPSHSLTHSLVLSVNHDFG